MHHITDFTELPADTVHWSLQPTVADVPPLKNDIIFLTSNASLILFFAKQINNVITL